QQVRGSRLSGHVNMQVTIDGHSRSRVALGPSEVGGIGESGSSGVQRRNEGVLNAAEGGLNNRKLAWEIVGLCQSGYVGAARRIYRNAEALVRAAAAQKSRINE